MDSGDGTLAEAEIQKLRDALGFKAAVVEEAEGAVEGAVADGAESAVDEASEERAAAGGGTVEAASSSTEAGDAVPPADTTHPLRLLTQQQK